MQPIAFAIGYFQGETSCYLGVVAPTVNAAILKLNSMTCLKLCNTLREKIVMNIKKRFHIVIDLNINDSINEHSKKFILSTVSHPKFKTSWIKSEFNEVCRKALLEEYKTISLSEKSYIIGNSNSDGKEAGSDDFFSISTQKVCERKPNFFQF